MEAHLKNTAMMDKLDRNTDEEILDSLRTEYASLVNLYTNAENSLSNVFNFYLTLLSAVVGLVIVLVQLNNTNIAAALPTIGALLAFLSLVGVIMQDAVVNKNVEISRYTLALNLLKRYLLKDSEEAMSNVLYISYYYARVSPTPIRKVHRIDHIHHHLWWLFPLGTEQLFIAVVDSFSLTALALMVAHLLSANTVSILQLSSVSMVSVFLLFEAHCIYARVKHHRGMENLITVAGDEVKWHKLAAA